MTILLSRTLSSPSLLRSSLASASHCSSWVSSSSSTSKSSQIVWKSTVASTPSVSSENNAAVPQLVNVPSLPLLGSFSHPWSGAPEYRQDAVLSIWPEMRRKFGEFYSIGMPGLGAGWNGTMYVIQDPNEMAKLLRSEGQYPFGSAELSFAIKRYFTQRGVTAVDLLKNGPAWKRVRHFVQTDLLAPASAQRYLPAVIESVPYISRGAPQYSDRMNAFLNVASFDMFSNVMMGTLPRICDPTFHSSPDDERFCQAVAGALRASSHLMTSVYDIVMLTVFNYETKLYREMHKNWDVALEHADVKIAQLQQAREAGTLTKRQESCYANQAFERQAAQKADDTGFITLTEARTIVSGLLAAGVDTTAGLLSWKLVHMAAHPHVQDRLYQELLPTLTPDGQLTEESVSPQKMPYLHACVRESHRLANTNGIIPIRKFSTPVEVHGVTLPAGSVVALDSFSTGVDPNIVGEDYKEYRPERFLKDAVLARKGTLAEKLDHAFFNGPFSQGARKCPGSRVANMEATVLLAQLVLDWRMEIPSIQNWSDVSYDLETVTTAQIPKIEFTARK